LIDETDVEMFAISIEIYAALDATDYAKGKGGRGKSKSGKGSLLLPLAVFSPI
jgi:hypothetical protein